MKKILSFILAAAMMTSVAMAAVVDGVDWDSAKANPGSTIEFANGFKAEETSGAYTKGEEITAHLKKYDVTDDNFTLKVSYKKGSELVEKAYIDADSNTVKVELKKNNLLERKENKAPNLVFDEVSLKARRTMKNDDGDKIIKAGDKFSVQWTEILTTGRFYNEWFIGYAPAVKIDLTSDEIDLPVNDDHYYVVNKSEAGDELKATVTAPITAGRVEFKVFSEDKFYFDVNEKFDDVMDVVKANEDADFDVYNFTTDGIGTMKVWFEDVEEGDAHIYKYDAASKKLTKANVKFDEEELCYYTTVRGDEIIIVAESDLNGVAASANGNVSNNPETGR